MDNLVAIGGRGASHSGWRCHKTRHVMSASKTRQGAHSLTLLTPTPTASTMEDILKGLNPAQLQGIIHVH